MIHITFWFRLTMLIYWVEVYILQKKKHRCFSSCSEVAGLEVNADRTKDIVMY